MEELQKSSLHLTDQSIDGVTCEQLTSKRPGDEKSSMEDSHVSLSDISFNVLPCELMVIVGNVGSGKV